MLRRLLPSELKLYEDHLIRLDHNSKNLRFAGYAADEVISQYVGKIKLSNKETVIGLFNKNNVVGATHLIFLADDMVELAISIESDFRKKGNGKKLFKKSIQWAENRGAKKLYSSCLPHNSAMISLARNHQMTIEYADGHSEAYLELDEKFDMTKVFGELYEENMVFSNQMFMKFFSS